MTRSLRIGEVAALLGVTQKTIRHYHRVGLLAEPERSPGGYRLYGARDLQRLLRIRRLQALGLSLAQIAQVLGAPDPERERSLRAVLEGLLDACTAQLRALESRRDRIRALLAEPAPSALDALDHPAATPAVLEWAESRLGAPLRDISPTVWEQDAQIFGLVESFHWPAEDQERMREAASQILAQPDVYHRLVDLAERLAALADVPVDSPEVERLAADVHRAGVGDLLTSLAPPVDDCLPDDPHANVIADLMLSALSPAQRRFLDLVRVYTRTDAVAGAPTPPTPT